MTAAAMPAYTPYLVAAAIAFAMYRRIRGHFGPQPWRPKRTVARVVLLSVVLAMLAIAAVFAPARAWGVGPGALTGAARGLLSRPLLRIEVIDGQRGYTPNPWIGVALTAVLLGRLASRFASGDITDPQASGPLTMAIAAALVTCYLVQGIGLLLRMRRLPTAQAVAS